MSFMICAMMLIKGAIESISAKNYCAFEKRIIWPNISMIRRVVVSDLYCWYRSSKKPFSFCLETMAMY